MADSIKDLSILKILNRMITNARYINWSLFFTLQSYYYIPKILQKPKTYIIIFKPKNIKEFYFIIKRII